LQPLTDGPHPKHKSPAFSRNHSDETAAGGNCRTGESRCRVAYQSGLNSCEKKPPTTIMRCTRVSPVPGGHVQPFTPSAVSSFPRPTQEEHDRVGNRCPLVD
uniref:Uncharacterized protein n=1 Tax=Mesocestoides corti TaxID=53468 RepID=A0A5K3FJ95_MESCO